ncbi:MAG: hypothetical protein ABJB34_01565, partial [Acidobacteriota bacterium]
EMRETTRLKVVHPEPQAEYASTNGNQSLFDDDLVLDESEPVVSRLQALTPERRDALKSLAGQLLELRQMLKTTHAREAEERLRK